METVSFLKPCEATSSFKIFFRTFLTSLGLQRIQVSGHGARLGCGLWECRGCFDLLSRRALAILLFCILIICMFTGVAVLISFKNFSFAFTTWLTGEEASFWAYLGLQHVSSLNLIISRFGFKLGDMQFFLSLERVINQPSFNNVVSQGIRRPEKREKSGGTPSLWSSQDTQHLLLIH